MVAMSMSIKRYFVRIVFTLILTLMPAFTYADALPNSQTVPPTVSQCRSGSYAGAEVTLADARGKVVSSLPAWANAALNSVSTAIFGGSSAGFFCEYNNNVLFYDTAENYLVAVDMA